MKKCGKNGCLLIMFTVEGNLHFLLVLQLVKQDGVAEIVEPLT